MDRGGGGGPPRRSSLPTALQRVLLPPRPHDPPSAYTDEPQALPATAADAPAHATYPTHPPRPTPAAAPAPAPAPAPPRGPPAFEFEQGSSRGPARRGAERALDDGRAAHAPPPPARHGGSTDPTAYAYAAPAYDPPYPPHAYAPPHDPHAPQAYAPYPRSPPPPRLPPLRVVEQTARARPTQYGDAARHTGYPDPARHTGYENPPRHASYDDAPRHTGYEDPVRHSSYGSPPRHSGYEDPPRPTYRYADAALEVHIPRPVHPYGAEVPARLHSQAQRAQTWAHAPRAPPPAAFPDPDPGREPYPAPEYGRDPRADPWLPEARYAEAPVARYGDSDLRATHAILPVPFSQPDPAPPRYHAPPEYDLRLSGGQGGGAPVYPVTYPDAAHIPHLRPFHEHHETTQRPFHDQTQYAPPSAQPPPPQQQFRPAIPEPEVQPEIPPPAPYAHSTPVHEDPGLPPPPYHEASATHAPAPAAEAGSPAEESEVRIPEPRVTRPRKRKARDEEDDEDDEDDVGFRPRKVARKTQIACFFCRGRKLKCDGLTPMCSNCVKRGRPCSYAPYPKRRGPGKATKGQRKAGEPRSAGPSGTTSGHGSATPTEQDAGGGAPPVYSPYAYEPAAGGGEQEHALRQDVRLPPLHDPYNTHTPPRGEIPHQHQYPVAPGPLGEPPAAGRMRGIWTPPPPPVAAAAAGDEDEGGGRYEEEERYGAGPPHPRRGQDYR